MQRDPGGGLGNDPRPDYPGISVGATRFLKLWELWMIVASIRSEGIMEVCFGQGRNYSSTYYSGGCLYDICL